jgi:hypothetical protein
MAEPVRVPGKLLLKRYVARALLFTLLIAAVAYAVDYAILRYRVATKRVPFGTVTVQSYDAVPQKDHKTEFLFENPHDETCVNSLFPHMGDAPCWYLRRHTEQRIDL